MPSLKWPVQTWNLFGSVCLQRPWPMLMSGASSAMWRPVGPFQWLLCPSRKSRPSTAAPAEEKRVAAKREEAEESGDDDMSSGLSD